MAARWSEDVKRILIICFAVLICLGKVVFAEPAGMNEDWIWISSNDKYSKFYLPKEIRVVKSLPVDGKDVPTIIQAWTKTTYSYGGALETIESYGIENIISDPSKLSYSLALIEIHPQNRTVEYVQENFYDAKGKVIWSKVYTSRTVKEINSQAFDEDFYTAIVDEILRYGETERRLAEDRWIDLWVREVAGGGVQKSIADTTTMRLKGDNLIYWEWIEEKDAKGNVSEIRFLKKAVNVEMDTERIISGKVWTPKHGWKDSETDRVYTAIERNPAILKGLDRLKKYVAGYQFWLKRYSLESKKRV